MKAPLWIACFSQTPARIGERRLNHESGDRPPHGCTKSKENVALLSVVSNTTLVVMKLIVGILIGSVSVMSEAIHSGVDLMAAVIALFSVKTSSLPADGRHPFGHGKIENISGTVEALLIFVAAGWIIWEAVQELLEPQPMETVGWGVAVMFFSAVANQFVARRLFKVGKETDSVALIADGWHLRTDVYTSAGVIVGLALIWSGEFLFPGRHFHWLDPVAAIGVAALIIKAAWDLTRQSAGGLMDETLPPEEEEEIRRLICFPRCRWSTAFTNCAPAKPATSGLSKSTSRWTVRCPSIPPMPSMTIWSGGSRNASPRRR